MTTLPPTARGEAYAHAQQGETFRMMGEYEQARVAFRAALSHDPTYTWAMAHLAATHRALQHYHESLQLFDQAINSEGGRRYPWAYAQRGETYRLQATRRYRYDVHQALVLFERSLEDHGHAIRLDESYAWSYAHRGATHRELGFHYEHHDDPTTAHHHYTRAREDFTRAIELNDGYAWAYAYRSVVARCLGDYEAAMDDLLQALLLNPTVFFDALYQQGMLHHLSGKSDAAVRHFRHALKQEPDNAHLLYGLAISRSQHEGVAAATNEIAQARNALAKNASLALFQLAALEHLEGNNEDAEAHLGHAHWVGAKASKSSLLGDVLLSFIRSDPTCQTGLAEDKGFRERYQASRNIADTTSDQEESEQ